MFIINKEEPLGPNELSKILPIFQTRDYPVLQRYWKYYQGQQDIFKRTSNDSSKKLNKICCNYCEAAVEAYNGYLTGIPIQYSYKENFEEIDDILKYNDVVDEDNEYLRQALIFGRAFEINYIDEYGAQRFKILDSRECVPVRANDLNNDLLYVVRFYKESPLDKQNDNYIVEVYGPDTVDTYRSDAGFLTYQFIKSEPHFFGQCPITEFSLNTDQSSIFKQIMGLNDCYNNLLSDEVDDFDAFADAYLVLTGAIADEDDLQSMKENRCLLLDEGCNATYLTKSINDTQITNMLQNINDQIYTKGCFPDYNNEKFMSQSGIALKYKLIGFENKASSIEASMRKALQRRIELINAILYKTDEVWREVDIVFTRNLPTDLTDNATIVNQLKGIVPDIYLYQLLPFIDNPEEAIKEMEKQNKQNMEMYSFEQNIPEEDIEDDNE